MMKKILIFISLIIAITSTVYCKNDSKTVSAEGMAPIINNDLESARKNSINDALKNALGLVVGIYISQEAYASKSILVEDNVTSQTQGYIESYKVIKTTQENNFIKTKIKATVKREDIEQKLKTLNLEPVNLGNPSIGFDIKEYKDNSLIGTTSPPIFKQIFTEKGFVVKDSSSTDIIVKGKIETYPNTEQAYEGLISYRSSAELSVIKNVSNELIHSYKDNASGIDISSETSSKNAITNVSAKILKTMPADTIDYLLKQSKIQITLYNIDDINKLSEIVLSIRALIEVKDCKVNSYNEPIAILDAILKEGKTSNDIAKRLESNQKFKIRSVTTYGIEAEIVK
jgi:hypothetical protein